MILKTIENGDAHKGKLPWFLDDPQRALEVYKNPQRYVSLDFETTAKEYGSALVPENQILLACWEVHDLVEGTVTKKHKWGDEYDMAELEADIRSAQFVVAHNAKFELQWLRRAGLDLHDILVFDTYLAEWVIAGNRGGQPGWELNLDATAKRYGIGQKAVAAKRLIDAGVDPEDIPREILQPYCHQDVHLCNEIYKRQIKKLIADGLLHLVLTRCLTAAALADIEFAGAQLDKQRVLETYEQTVNEFNELEDKLAEFTGGINLASPIQLSDYLYGKLGFPPPVDFKGKPLLTKKGKYKTDAKTLDKLKASTPEQAEFIKLYKQRNRLDSLLTKNLLFFKLVCEQQDGVFHGNVNQGFTQTHRLASTGRPKLFAGQKVPRGTQFQNMPRVYKSLFKAHDPDYLDCEADGAQLEFRVAVALSRDPVGIDMIVHGSDVHADTAKVYVDWNAANRNQQHPDFIGLDYKAARQPAKAQTFKPTFGGRGQHPAEQEYCKFFREKYNVLAKTQQDWTYEVLDSGKLRTPYGMIFHWPGTTMGRSGYIDNTTSIYNYPIQGLSTGEIIPIALVYFWHRVRYLRVVIWNTIHDSIASRVHREDVEKYKEVSKRAFTRDVYNYLSNVYNFEFCLPLGVGVKVGEHWGESEVEEIWEVSPDGNETYKCK